jgi:hypothetical protein
MLDLAEPQKTIIRLTQRERSELQECESVVTSGLSEFLRVGKALSTIRNKRLFRETHPSFESYVTERWGLGIGATGTLITSYHIAEQLEESGINLPPETTQSAMRALSKLSPVEGLRAATWRFATHLAPGSVCPPVSLLQKISRIIRSELDDGTDVDGAGNRVDDEKETPAESTEGRPPGDDRRKNVKNARDDQFLRALIRMSSYQGFSIPLIVSQIGSEKVASHTWQACEKLKGRLAAFEAALIKAYPHAQARTA